MIIPQPMAKNVSSSVAPLHSKKRKQQKKRRPRLMKKFLDYMKSDTFMFAPYVLPQSCPIPISSSHSQGEEEGISGGCGSILNTREKGYLRCDCYMYAPFVPNSSDMSRPIAVEKIRAVRQEMVKQRVVVGRNSCRSSPPPGKKAVFWKEPREIIL